MQAFSGATLSNSCGCQFSCAIFEEVSICISKIPMKITPRKKIPMKID
jgi:hypothetical protein